MYCSLLRLQFTSSSLHKAIADALLTYLLTTAVALLNDHSNTNYYDVDIPDNLGTGQAVGGSRQYVTD